MTLTLENSEKENKNGQISTLNRQIIKTIHKKRTKCPKNTDNLFCAANENKMLFLPIKLVRF